MDALAAITWLLREAVAQGNRESAGHLARSLYTVLLINGIEWQSRELSEPQLGLFSRRILPMGSPPHRCFCMSGQGMLDASVTLNFTVYQAAAVKRRWLTWLQRVRVMCRLFTGDASFDVLHALAPHYLPDPHVESIPERVLIVLLRDEEWRRWVWKSITSSQPEAFPPAAFRGEVWIA
ncbi:MAG: hypothetical protein Q8R69_00155 [Telluria sp.]|nr:hypothetical protein [Telluria sp.]